MHIDKITIPHMVISMRCDLRCIYIGRAYDDNWELHDPTGRR